jgi:hypothetical protein
MDTAFIGLTSSQQITTIEAGYYSEGPVLKRDGQRTASVGLTRRLGRIGGGDAS